MKHLILAGTLSRKDAILGQLRELGVVHLVPLAEISAPSELKNKLDQTSLAVKILSKQNIADKQQSDDNVTNSKVMELVSATIFLTEELACLKNDLFNLQTEYKELEPWGNFDIALLKSMQKNNLIMQLWTCRHNEADNFVATAVKIVQLTSKQAYVVTVTRKDDEKPQVPQLANEVLLPNRSVKELQNLIEATSQQILSREKEIASLAGWLFVIKKALAHFEDEKKLAEANSGFLTNDYFFVVEGWIPADLEKVVQDKFADLTLVIRDPVKGAETPPVKFKNNRFVKPFELLVKAFTGISYFSSIDTTWCVAVLFPIFAAFCLNDAGYGLAVIIIGIFLGKKETSKEFGQICITTGIATIILGALSAQYFGWTLYKPILKLGNPEFTMNASLVVGILVTLFALTMSVIKNGWRHNATGTILFLLGLGLALLGFFAGKVMIAIGVLFWVLFPDSIFGNKISDAIWQCYGTIAGLFGDILSYLRLFALSISGSLLAIIIDEFANGMPIGVNILFLVSCHGLLLGLSLISVYIHANRLIFLEFGSRCVDGGTVFYKPFSL